jgi:hypothetical protein
VEQHGTLWEHQKRICTPLGSAGGMRTSGFSLGFPAFSLKVAENVRKCQAFGRFSPGDSLVAFQCDNW